MATAVAPEVHEYRSEDEKLQAALAQVHQLADAAVDAVIPQAGLRFIGTHGQYRAQGADPIYLMAETPDGSIPLRVLDGAHEQFSEKLGIPLPYYRKMLNEVPALLAENANVWLRKQPEEERLLRMVKPLPGADRLPFDVMQAPLAVRAYLSNGYKVIDHESVLKVLAPEMQARNARVDEWNLSDKKFHVRVTLPVANIRDYLVPGDHTFINEMVAIGVQVRNSETGHAAVAVEVFARILRCVNGLIMDEPLRIAHLGKRQEADVAWLSDQTRRLTDAADVLRIRDRIRAGFSDDQPRKVAAQIAKASGEPVPVADVPAFLKFVGNVGARYDLSKAEVEALEGTAAEELVQAQVGGHQRGGANRWNVSQAFTALARNIGNDGDFERKVELERIGWKVLADPVEALLKAGKSGSN